ncbi:SLC13 family permease [Thermodesulfobacteriota bacterium]
MFNKLMPNIAMVVSMTSLVLAIALLIFPPPLLSTTESLAAAVAIIVIGFWASAVIPEYMTALFFFLFAVLSGIAPSEVIFSGFASTAFWLIFSGLVIAEGITATGLGTRIASKIVAHFKGSYLRLITSILVAGMLFAFLMPGAVGRVIFLIPIVSAVADYAGFTKGSNGRTGMMLAAIFGTILPGFAILPANVPNMIFAGMVETRYQIPILYGEYFWLHFPVLGLLKAITIVVSILYFFPDYPQKTKSRTLLKTDSISKNEIALSAVLLLLITLWMSDFIHHISPAWIALGGAVFLLLPKINIVTKQQFQANINFSILFFVAGIFGLGGMIHHSELGETLASQLIRLLPLDQSRPFTNYMLLSLISTLTGIVVTVAGIPAVITPFCDTLSNFSGFPLKTVLMTQVLGFSTIILPYQLAPIVIGMQMSGERLQSAIKLCLFLLLITFVFLLPVNYLWWQVLSWI